MLALERAHHDVGVGKGSSRFAIQITAYGGFS